jgi:hypothetical protein
MFICFFPIIPFIAYSFLFIKYRQVMSKKITETTSESQSYREVSLTLIGIIFSVSGILGVFKESIPRNSNLVLFFITSCLMSFLIVFFLQRFRYKYWHDILTDCFLDSGLLLLILSIPLIIYNDTFSITMIPSIISLIGWFFYVFFHICNYSSFLNALKEVANV